MKPTTITCPNCNQPISIDEVLKHQVESSIKLEYEQKSKAEADEIRRKAKQWQEEQQEKTEKEIKALRLKIKEEQSTEVKELQEELQKRKEEAQIAKDQELALRKKANELEEREKNLKLETQRQIDEERKKIQQKTESELTDKFHLKEKEKEQIIESLKKSLEDAQRKANQGSQQLQGEVLELELEEFLKKEFPLDGIEPVAKGIRGADVMQKVRDSFGRECGTIIWESKRTKNWSEEWVQKLKDDMRTSGADIAILVSSVLPDGIKFFGPKDGIFVTCFECILGVSSQIRLALMKEGQIKNSVVGKNEKMEVLWNYLSSNQFNQKVEAIVEAFSAMKADLEKEKRAYQQIWSRREQQIERVITSTVGMHGQLQGLMGAALPSIDSLELDNFDLISETSTQTVVSTSDDTVIQTTLTQTVIEDNL